MTLSEERLRDENAVSDLVLRDQWADPLRKPGAADRAAHLVAAIVRRRADDLLLQLSGGRIPGLAHSPKILALDLLDWLNEAGCDLPATHAAAEAVVEIFAGYAERCAAKKRHYVNG